MKKEFAEYIRLVAKTIGTDYKSQSECREAITSLLTQLNKKHIELTGETMYKPKSLLKHIVTPNAIEII